MIGVSLALNWGRRALMRGGLGRSRLLTRTAAALEETGLLVSCGPRAATDALRAGALRLSQNEDAGIAGHC